MIHVAGKAASMKEIKDIDLVRPVCAGAQWRGVRHWDLISAIRNEIAKRKWIVASEKYTLARNDADMAGGIVLEKIPGMGQIAGMRYAIGFAHSNARRMALRMAVGVQVSCCANGMVSGTLKVRRRHNHTIELAEVIDAAITDYEEHARQIPDTVRGMRETLVSNAEASEILMRCGSSRMIGWAAVGRVWREYQYPAYTEHGKGTSWALLNAFTYAASQNIAPMRQIDVFNAFRGMLPKPNIT